MILDIERSEGMSEPTWYGVRASLRVGRLGHLVILNIGTHPGLAMTVADAYWLGSMLELVGDIAALGDEESE